MEQTIEDKIMSCISDSLKSFMERHSVSVDGKEINWSQVLWKPRERKILGEGIFPWESLFQPDFPEQQEEEEQETEMSHDLAIRLLKMPNLPIGFPSVKEWNYDDAKIYRVELTEVDGRNTSTGEDTKIIILGPELHES